MTTITPLRCAYCDEISEWSSEQIELTETSSAHSCPECGQTLSMWEDESNAHDLLPEVTMGWSAPDPLF